MSLLIKTAKLSKLCAKNSPVVFTATRNHLWNKDFLPGPYPVTLEERKAAAAKYNLSVEEYEPYPDDGDGFGDYPKLPLVSMESKDPFYPYDNPELKRNYGETLHMEFDLIRDDRYDVSAQLRYPLRNYWITFIGVMLGAASIFLLGENMKVFPGVMPEQKPNDGKKHYTFEAK